MVTPPHEIVVQPELKLPELAQLEFPRRLYFSLIGFSAPALTRRAGQNSCKHDMAVTEYGNQPRNLLEVTSAG